MSQNDFFKEVFEREFARLQSSGINKQTAAAQAIASAQSIVSERMRYEQPITQSPHSMVIDQTTMTRERSISPGSRTAMTGMSTGESTIASTNSNSLNDIRENSNIYDQDKRKGKLAANICSMSDKKITTTTPIMR